MQQLLPSSPISSYRHAADIAACRALLRGGSRSFFVASLLLPRRVRHPASALYAFCRLADDAVDIDTDRCDAVARLRDRLDRVYEGRPLEIPADRALADIVARFGIPKALLEALLEGFEWDSAGRRYDDMAALLGYAARVAGSVGAMMAILMQVRSPEVLARACDLGLAMQLSNIVRDVGEDARNGRLYLPQNWLRDAGIDPDAWLARPVYNDALGSVVKRVLITADVFYDRSDMGTPHLPFDCRPGIHAARLLYAEIGHEVARRECDSVASRAVVPSRRKVWLLASSLGAIRMPKQGGLLKTADEAHFLVEAVATTAPRPATVASKRRNRRRALGERIIWVIDLFERLERMERGGRFVQLNAEP